MTDERRRDEHAGDAAVDAAWRSVSRLEALLLKVPDLEFRRQWDEPIPPEVLSRLLRIPYFERGYREDGYSNGEFNAHPALVATAREFSAATRGMVDFIAERIRFSLD